MKLTIAMFINDPKCSVQFGNGLLKALEDHYHFKLFSKNEMEDGFFDKNIDMVAFPGGFGDSDSFDTLLGKNGKYVRKFVERGGKYLGICMGAFWAGKLNNFLKHNTCETLYLVGDIIDAWKIFKENLT